MRNLSLASLSLIALLAAGATEAQAQPTPEGRAGGIRNTRPSPAPRAAPQASTSDQGITGPLHAAHQGQIVFTRTDLSLGAITEGALSRDFVLGQPMFFRVFMERSAVNHLANRNGLAAGGVYADGVLYKARFSVQGKVIETSFAPWGGGSDHRTWTTWRGQLLNPDFRAPVPGSEVMLEFVARATGAGLLGPGIWPVTMEVFPLGPANDGRALAGDPVARGSFNLTVPAGVIRPSNPLLCLPGRGAAGNAAIEARTMSVSRQVWHENGTVPVKAIAIGNDWEVTRNEITGIPIERTTKVLVLARGPEFCTSHIHEFTEKHMGGGNYATSTGGVSNRVLRGYVPCACLG
ncbi:hypothetical protein P1X14_11810 [Sphingomonas sp. AOB5]|uniref:hypothetical protein n=1 Tax=Sphingomonas sp. AOB5 TaxID=3034017 RepID=UPI0023F73340|nr:hypothetical protein [Sphingomonas sp. AOB5]MDF7775933.1 hypothetical protein [Sphingomonas sp. AOB5]